jgi:hypothetical protein
MKELCSSTGSARGSILNWRKGLDSPEEESDERRRQPPCHARYRFKSSATCSINELIIQPFLIKIAGLVLLKVVILVTSSGLDLACRMPHGRQEGT